MRNTVEFSSVAASPVGDIIDQLTKNELGVFLSRYIGALGNLKPETGNAGDLRAFSGFVKRGKLADAHQCLMDKAERFRIDLDKPSVGVTPGDLSRFLSPDVIATIYPDNAKSQPKPKAF